jgi:hypothetical protein
MNKMELRERLEELRRAINVTNTMVFNGNKFQVAAWMTKSLQLIRGILKDLSNE